MLRVSRCSFFALFWVGLAAFQSPGSAGDFLPAFEVEDLRRFPKLTHAAFPTASAGTRTPCEPCTFCVHVEEYPHEPHLQLRAPFGNELHKWPPGRRKAGSQAGTLQVPLRSHPQRRSSLPRDRESCRLEIQALHMVPRCGVTRVNRLEFHFQRARFTFWFRSPRELCWKGF